MEDIIEWFDNNYIEERATILKILEESTIKHNLTIVSLFEGCQIMKQAYQKKTSLRGQVQYFAKLADYGINGSKAGEKLRAYFFLMIHYRKDYGRSNKTS
jgi:hypothetical protein